MKDVKVGDRIKLLAMPEDPDPIAPGSTGTVTYVGHVSLGREDFVQVGVKWDDDARSLWLTTPPDRFEILK